MDKLRYFHRFITNKYLIYFHFYILLYLFWTVLLADLCWSPRRQWFPDYTDCVRIVLKSPFCDFLLCIRSDFSVDRLLGHGP